MEEKFRELAEIESFTTHLEGKVIDFETVIELMQDARNLTIQSKKYSILESITNVIVGLVISFIIQIIIYPLLNIPVSIKQNIIITIVFFIASFIRGYVIRRVFNKYSQ